MYRMGHPVAVSQALMVINAAVAEAKKRSWKMNVAVADSGGNLVAFQRMDGAMLASIQIAEHKARAAATFRRPTKVFEEGVQYYAPQLPARVRRSHCVEARLPLIETGARSSARSVARVAPIRRMRWSARRARQ